jgi:U4/U6.U5 tri-snRNP-associated protein 2
MPDACAMEQSAKRRRVGDDGRARDELEAPEPNAVRDGASLASTAPAARPGAQCPYMHTLNRHALDFDFEKVCSVSLEAHNVYACLVCGRYFQGRGPASHAFAHSLDVSHHLFLNLRTERVYCLPDGYAVADPALHDVAFVLHPKFDRRGVARLDTPPPRRYITLDGARQLQGVTPLDNLHASDYANVVFQMLLAVLPLRNFFLLAPYAAVDGPNGTAPSSAPPPRLIHELSVLAKKLWTPLAFRAHVSPHDIMQQVSSASNRRFGPLHQADPTDFFAWLIHTLHRELQGFASALEPSGTPPHRLLPNCLQGTLEITTIRDGKAAENEAEIRTTAMSKFWFLTLDLPPKPLFKDTSERTLVAQVPLTSLLAKYDGASQHHVVKTGERRCYRLVRLPPYLVMTVKRMTRTKFATEKNPAIILCPVTGLSLGDLCPGGESAPDAAQTYSLASVIVHDGPHDKGTYKVAVRHLASGKWFGLENMTVTEVLPQLFSLGETCILLYARD